MCTWRESGLMTLIIGPWLIAIANENPSSWLGVKLHPFLWVNIHVGQTPVNLEMVNSQVVETLRKPLAMAPFAPWGKNPLGLLSFPLAYTILRISIAFLAYPKELEFAEIMLFVVGLILSSKVQWYFEAFIFDASSSEPVLQVRYPACELRDGEFVGMNNLICLFIEQSSYHSMLPCFYRYQPCQKLHACMQHMRVLDW